MVSLSWTGFALVALVLTQTIIFLVTLFFHRACAHRSIVLHPRLHRVCTFLAWFLMGMDPQEFAAVHRKHHATCDTMDDPHSPVRYGWAGVLFGGVVLYQREAHKTEVIEQYGKGLPHDPLTGFYRRHGNLGVLLLGAVLMGLFGWKGALLWGMDLLWIPFWAAGVVNGLGHHIGYRNHQTDDLSTNLVPWGVWIGGEELHNNHHAFPASAKFSRKPWEVDIGWGAIVALRALGWCTVRADAASGVGAGSAEGAAATGLGAFLRDRHAWLERFHNAVQPHARAQLLLHRIASWRRLSCWSDRGARLGAVRRGRLNGALADPILARVHGLETELRRMWAERGHATAESVAAWCAQARAVGWAHLDRFADQMAAAVGIAPFGTVAPILV